MFARDITAVSAGGVERGSGGFGAEVNTVLRRQSREDVGYTRLRLTLL